MRDDLQKKIEERAEAVGYPRNGGQKKQVLIDLDTLLSAVDEYVKEHDKYVIGEKHLTDGGYDEGYFKNELRAKQLKRAGIE